METLQQPDYKQFVKNWYNLPPEKIDNLFYFNAHDMSDKAHEGQNGESKEEPSWFRILLFEVKIDKDFTKNYLNSGRCILRLGVKNPDVTKCKDVNEAIAVVDNNSFFMPFIELEDIRLMSTTGYELFAVNHLKSNIFYHYWNNAALGSAQVPEKFVQELQYNWLISSPGTTSNHFKSIKWEDTEIPGLRAPSIKLVTSYIYNPDNFRRFQKSNQRDIQKAYVSMGLNLNNNNSEYPTFAPILIFQLEPGATESANEDYYFEELANPCPPTCDDD